MNSSVTTAEYDRIFGAYMASDDFDIPEEYRDDFMRFVEELLVMNLEIESNPASKDAIMEYHLNAPATDTGRVYLMVRDDHSGATCIPFRTDDGKFNTQIMADPEQEGIYEVSYFTVVSGDLKMSAPKTVVFSPKLTGVTSIAFAGGETIHGHVGDEVFLGLVATTESGNYDISAPSFDIAAYTVSDSSVAEITSDGKVKALKEGRATITATAYGKTASVNVIVRSDASEEDTTRDIIVVSYGGNNPGSSSGGCTEGFTVIALLSVLGLALKRR